MRIVVAGGRGFIGTHVVEKLAGAGHRVIAAGPGEVDAAVARQRTDAVVWAAGHRADDPDLMHRQHVADPLAALCAGAMQRFVYLSTGEIYGRSTVPFCVGNEAPGSHPYPQAKARGESELARMAAARGTALTVLRLSLVYGPGQTGAMFLPTLIAHVRDRQPVALTAGEQTRDYVYVTDVARAVALALHPDAAPGIYNVGSGVESRLRDVGSAVITALDGDPALLRWGARPYRRDEQMRYVFDTAATRVALGFEATVSLADGIRRMVHRP